MSSAPRLVVEQVEGDVLDQPVDAVVNPWNRNFMPRWMPSSGVSGMLKKLTGPQPWIQLKQAGILRPGQAVITGGGLLDVDLVHVAGLNALWRATPTTVQTSARNAALAAWEGGYRAMSMPLIGSGTGGMKPAVVEELIVAALAPYTVPAAEADAALPAAGSARSLLLVRVVTWHGKHTKK